MLNYDEKFSNKLSHRIKGESLLTFPSDYTVIDLETTGLAPASDDIIELSAIKVRDDKVINSFTSLVKPEKTVSTFINKLTGISNEMLLNAPSIEEKLKEYLEFIGSDIVLGHNVNFDINFIYDKSVLYYNKAFSNDYTDTLKIARKLKLNCANYKLSTLAQFYEVQCGRMHRGLEDCRVTNEVYKGLKKYVSEKMREFLPV